MVVTCVPDKSIEVKLEHLKKAPETMLVKRGLVGKVTEVKPEQLRKAFEPMVSTESGIMIEVKPVCWKALLPMVVTESGMVIEVIPELEKA